MIKTIPLVRAILKGFARNWKSILLLIIFPLIFISLIFLSFNPNGLQKVPVGLVGLSQELDLEPYKENYFSYLYIENFKNITDCIAELKIYSQYACIEVSGQKSYNVDVYYDNTREPVIWEVIERIKSSIDLLQKKKSKEIATDFLTKFSENLGKIESFKNNLAATNLKIDGYISQTDNSIAKLQSSKADLKNSLYLMDKDINSAKAIKSSLKQQKDSFYFNTLHYTASMDNSAGSITNITDYQNLLLLGSIRQNIVSINDRVFTFNTLADGYFNNFDSSISQYEDTSAKGKSYVSEIDLDISKLSGVKNDLIGYKVELENSGRDIIKIQSDFQSMQGLDTEQLVNPIVIYNKPTYIPDVGDLAKYLGNNADTAKNLVKGINLISLQTIFPTMLLLITLFLSLLISSFVCLGEINSPSYNRIRLIKGIFFHEIISIYLSSLIIMVIPIICVMALGQYLFRINILSNFAFILLVLFLLSSIFIMLGMALAYLIKKESITLLVSTFILTFMIFFSGFLLPIERMSNTAALLAPNFPVRIALISFNKVVFYSQDMSSVFLNIRSLIIWFFFLIMAVVVIKWIRR